MVNLQDIRYVRLGTRDVDARGALCDVDPRPASEAGRDARRASTSAATRATTRSSISTATRPTTPSAFEVADGAALDAAAAEIEAHACRCAWARATSASCAASSVSLQFRDPSGNGIDLVVRAVTQRAPRTCRRATPASPASRTSACARPTRRATRRSGRACATRACPTASAPAPLLRIDAVHHRIALFPSTYAGVQHVNHQVAGVDDIMRAYYFLRERGVRIVFGPGRHPTSSAIFLYFEGPDGMVYEYSTGVRTIDDEATLPAAAVPVRAEFVLHVGLAAGHSGVPQLARKGLRRRRTGAGSRDRRCSAAESPCHAMRPFSTM